MARLEGSTPLLSCSEASINTLKPRLDTTSKHNIVSKDVFHTQRLPSSPFESIVESVVDQENQPPRDHFSPAKHQSPSKAEESPVNTFTIFDDTETVSVPRQHTPTSCMLPQHSSFDQSLLHYSPPQGITDSSTPVKRHSPSGNAWENHSPGKLEQGPITLVQEEDEHDAPSYLSEDTCISAFSAVPNADMAVFSHLGCSARGNSGLSNQQTPRASQIYTPRTSNKLQLEKMSPAPTPTSRRNHIPSREGDTTNLLLDFTQQFEGFANASRQPLSRHGSPGKCSTEPNLLSYINGQRMPSPAKGVSSTPASRRNLLNLLDFDLPPQPTPRSIPTITVRELESLKSSYLSEISSLKASLSGREAEVESLKKAVGDAERRVGEALETVREERSAREHAEKEKSGWEKKGQEVEMVLNSVREEYLVGEREKEELQRKLEESNRLREEAEAKAAAVETKIPDSPGATSAAAPRSILHDEVIIEQQVAAQLDEKMENLARELHAVYKKKHELKIASLKEMYKARAEKKHNELHQQIAELARQNEILHNENDKAMSGGKAQFTAASASCITDEPDKQSEMMEQQARIAKLQKELESIHESHAQVEKALEKERSEKGELVAAVDEMLSLQVEGAAQSAIDDLRKSIARPPSGLRAPMVAAESRIGRLPAPTGGMVRTTSGSKSRMMSNIERMGSGRPFD